MHSWSASFSMHWIRPRRLARVYNGAKAPHRGRREGAAHRSLLTSNSSDLGGPGDRHDRRSWLDLDFLVQPIAAEPPQGGLEKPSLWTREGRLVTACQPSTYAYRPGYAPNKRNWYGTS